MGGGGQRGEEGEDGRRREGEWRGGDTISTLMVWLWHNYCNELIVIIMGILYWLVYRLACNECDYSFRCSFRHVSQLYHVCIWYYTEGASQRVYNTTYVR